MLVENYEFLHAGAKVGKKNDILHIVQKGCVKTGVLMQPFFWVCKYRQMLYAYGSRRSPV